MKKKQDFDAKKAADSILKKIGVDMGKIPPEIRNAEIIIENNGGNTEQGKKK